MQKLNKFKFQLSSLIRNKEYKRKMMNNYKNNSKMM